MTVIRTFYSGDRLEPDEYECTSPVECEVCGEVWDEDDHIGEEFTYHPDSDLPVCLGSCYEIHSDDLLDETQDNFEDNDLWEEAA